MQGKFSRRTFLKGMGLAAAAGGANLVGVGHLARAYAQTDLSSLPKLVYIFPGGAQADVARVQEALSQYMADKIGATIELRAVDWGAYDQQIGLINASAEPYDIAFTAPWINNYYNNVSQEYLLPIQDLLQQHAPNYWASLTEKTWDAARVAGNIYGGINQQIFVKPFGPYLRSDVAEELGLTDALLAVTSYDELTPIMAEIKKYIDSGSAGDLTNVSYNLSGVMIPENWGHDPQDFMLVVDSKDDSATVLIQSQTEGYRKGAELVREWYQAGYAPTDVQTWGQQDDAWVAGQFAVRVSDIVKPGGNAEVAARWGYEVISKAVAEPLLTTGGVTATLNGVSSVSQNPELAVKFLELVNSDPVFYNLLCKGIEGVHWEWEDQAQQLIKSIPDSGYAPNTDWMYGNVFNSYYTDPTQVGAWPETAELNRNARPSPVLGFTFDRSAVETEIASVTAVRTEFADPLGTGTVDVDEQLTKLNDALIAAGIEKVRDEMQRQIDAWKA
jgi:putative aldouronate transport system substrate-binding protein